MPKKTVIVTLIVIVLAAVIGVGLFMTRKALSLVIDIYKPNDVQNGHPCPFYLRLSLVNRSFVPITSYKVFVNGKMLAGMLIDYDWLYGVDCTFAPFGTIGFVIPLLPPSSEPEVLVEGPLVEALKRLQLKGLQIDELTNWTFEVEVVDTLGRRSIISRTLEKEVLDEIKGCASYMVR